MTKNKAEQYPYRIVPANDRADMYAAGFDGNRFASRDEAEMAIPGLIEAQGGEPNGGWVVVAIE